MSRTSKTAIPPAKAVTTSKSAGKQTLRRMHRAAEILAAARETFLEKGFGRASVGEIATKVGVVESLVYAYYPTKRDLLNEVMRSMYEPLIHDIDSGFSRLQGLRSRLRFLIWRHLRVFVEDPQMTRLVLHDVRTSPEYFSSGLRDLQLRYIEFMTRTVREAVAAGELPHDTDVELVRSMVYGGIEHRMWATLFGHGTIDIEVFADRYTDMVLRSIAPGDAIGPADGSPESRNEIEHRLARLEKIVAAGAPLDPPAARSRKRKP
jgi:AcrR family transcriptional regulator